jgi:outer membrane lipoprotein-sorting protein
MNTLDRTLELLVEREPDAALVNTAQRTLDALLTAKLASRVAARPVRPARGWIAAAASAVVAAVAVLWLPLGSTPAVAFADVQKHFRDFQTLRFDVEQRMNGKTVMTSRISLTRDGDVRTDVGTDISVIVNASTQRVLTLVHPARRAMVVPLGAPTKHEDALAWMEDIRKFQGEARVLPQTRQIRGQKAYGWELPTAAGKMVLWASADGLPLEMTMGETTPLQLSFNFEFDAPLNEQLFSTEIPSGYSRGEAED